MIPRLCRRDQPPYLLGFSPQRLDGKVHKLEVRVTQPGLSARARKSYLAAAGALAPSGR
jgi:hypothetical protein